MTGTIDRIVKGTKVAAVSLAAALPYGCSNPTAPDNEGAYFLRAGQETQFRVGGLDYTLRLKEIISLDGKPSAHITLTNEQGNNVTVTSGYISLGDKTYLLNGRFLNHEGSGKPSSSGIVLENASGMGTSDLSDDSATIKIFNDAK